MCVLKVYSATHSFKEYAGTTSIPVFSTKEKGDIRSRARNEFYKYFCISFDVSEKDWDDFPGQVEDAIEFLKKYSAELTQLCARGDIYSAELDFPIESRLGKEIANQNDHLPAELIRLAGKIGLSICMSQYSPGLFS